MATKFKNLTNKDQKPQELMKTNRPQSAIKQTRNGGAASFENKRNSTKPNAGVVRAATKSSATPAKSGSGFKSFIKGK